MFALINNPVSGGGGHYALTDSLKDILEKRGEQVQVYVTRCEGDGETRAREAMAQGCDQIAIIGGDGSLSDASRALAGSEATLFIVPCGTGNDFATAFGLPTDPERAFVDQLAGEPARIDCGAVNGKPFINIAGTGFDVEVLRKTEELRKEYPGPQAYRKALVSVLRSYHPMEMEVALDDGDYKEKKLTIIEIANGQYIGGGMRVAPNAVMDDGLFDAVTISGVPRAAIPLLLPMFYTGSLLRLPVASVHRAKRVRVRREGMIVNIDGRLEAMDEAELTLLPRALRVMRPAER